MALNHTMQRMRASRSAQLQFGRPRRLARTADGDRSIRARANVKAGLVLFVALLVLAPAVEAQFDYVTNERGTVTITKYTGLGGHVIIPASTNGLPVTEIGEFSFNSWVITSVTIPDSVTMIGNDAFNGSTVTNVIIGNGVTSIGDRAFLGCTNLLTLTIGNSVTNIGNEAFRVCFVLRSVTIPRSVAYIGDRAFCYAALLIQRQIYFMGDAPSLGLDVFAYNPDSTAYYLPGRTGWSATYGGIPTSLWQPQVLI